MSYALYDNLAGLRTWRQNELALRRRIRDAIVERAETTARDVNRAWAFEEIEAPLMMPIERMSSAYTSDDVFMLQDAPGGTKKWALRAETTDGTYCAATQILRTTNIKAPLCVWQMGTSFRRELNDGATAARLRFNGFTQLELQMIYYADTANDIVPHMRDALVPLVARLTGLETRLFETTRRPSYSDETVDIECRLPDVPDDADEELKWREVASTSRRTDFPTPPGYKPLVVLEIAFGMDRLVALSNGTL